MNNQKPANKRGAARLAAVQALYQMELGGTGVNEVVNEFEQLRLGKELDGDKYLAVDGNWFKATVSGVVELQSSIDPLIHEALPDTWPLKRLEIILRSILRAGVFELIKRKDVPSSVVISEYVDVTHAFFGDDEPPLVNAVLDRISKKLRPEIVETANKLD